MSRSDPKLPVSATDFSKRVPAKKRTGPPEVVREKRSAPVPLGGDKGTPELGESSSSAIGSKLTDRLLGGTVYLVVGGSLGLGLIFLVKLLGRISPVLVPVVLIALMLIWLAGLGVFVWARLTGRLADEPTPVALPPALPREGKSDFPKLYLLLLLWGVIGLVVLFLWRMRGGA